MFELKRDHLPPPPHRPTHTPPSPLQTLKRARKQTHRNARTHPHIRTHAYPCARAGVPPGARPLMLHSQRGIFYIPGEGGVGCWTRSMALRLPMCRADRSHSSAVIMKYAHPPPLPSTPHRRPLFPPTVYSRRGRKLGPVLLKMLHEHLSGIRSIWAHLSSMCTFPQTPRPLLNVFYSIYCFFACCCFVSPTRYCEETRRRTCCRRVVIAFTHETI